MGTISRQTTWSTGDTLTASAINSEFDNILSTANGSINADNLGVTAGQASASKAVVLDGNKDFANATGSNQIRNLTISGSLKIGTTFLPDASGGADLGSTSLEWGDVYVADDKYLYMGSGQDIKIGYDETTTDSLAISAAEGAGLSITLRADEGDDAGDEWKLLVADGGTMTLGNDIASAGTFVTHLTLTPHATVSSSTLALAGALTVAGTAGITGVATVGGLTIGSAVINEAELETIDGITAGTALASKALVLDSNKDIGTIRNITIDGTFSDGNYTFDTSGNVSGLGTVASGTITATDTTAPLVLKYDAGEYVTHAVSSAGVYSITTTDASSDSGAITLDTVDAITLDSDTASEGIVYSDGGTSMLQIFNSSSDVIIKQIVNGKDIVFQQDDGNEVIRVGNDRKLYFYDEGGEYISSSGSALTIASGSAAWEFPAADGSANEVLKTDGSGNLDWVAQTSGATLSGSTDDTIVTVTGANAMQGEANLKFDSSQNLTATSTSSNKPLLTLKNTHNGATSGIIKFINDKGAAGADNDVCGTITFYGDDDNQDNIEFARIEGIVADASNGDECGAMKLYVAENDGNNTVGLALTGSTTDGEVDVTVGAGTASVVTVPGHIDLAGNIDVDGTTNLDAVDIDGATQIDGTVTVGVNGTGYDVQLFGDTSGSSVLWDQSADDLILTNAGLAVGSDATGDLYYRNSSGFLARLGVGSDGQVLTSTGTLPNWEAASSGVSLATSDNDDVVTVTGSNAITGESTWTYSSTQAMALSSSTAHRPEIVLTNTHSDADSAPVLKFKHDKGANGANNDAAGQIYFYGDTDNQTNAALGRIDSILNYAPNSDHAARMDFHVARGGGMAPEPQSGSENNAGLSIIGDNAVGEINVRIGTGSGCRILSPGAFVGQSGSFDEDGGQTTGYVNQGGTVETICTGQYKNAIRASAEHASYGGTNVQIWTTRSAGSNAGDFYQLRIYANALSDPQFSLSGNGSAYADGSWSATGGDYQEFFETLSGGALEVGKCAVLDNDKVRLYDADSDEVEDIIGVVRPKGDQKNSAVIGNTAWANWKDKYMTDDYGRYLHEDREVVTWDHPDGPEWDHEKNAPGKARTVSHYADAVPEDVTVPADAVRSMQSVRKLNPDFDGDREYVNREDRDEWALIGLLGQVQVKAGETVPSRWIKMKAISGAVDMYLVR